jgi:hypothetical protein
VQVRPVPEGVGGMEVACEEEGGVRRRVSPWGETLSLPGRICAQIAPLVWENSTARVETREWDEGGGQLRMTMVRSGRVTAEDGWPRSAAPGRS